MRTRLFSGLILSVAACALTLAGCILDSKDGKSRLSATVSYEGYIGYVQEYTMSDTGVVPGDTLGLGFTTNEALVRLDTTGSSGGLSSITWELDSIALSFKKPDTTLTYKLGKDDCKITATGTAIVPNGGATVSAPLTFSHTFVSLEGISVVIDEQKSKPSNVDTVNFYGKAITGTYTVSCPDPR